MEKVMSGFTLLPKHAITSHKIFSLLIICLVFFNSSLAQTASNGITKQGNDFRLGGTLTDINAVIDLGSSYFFKLKKSTQDYLIVTNAGNVGIGLSSPSYLLDVNGAVRIGSLTADPIGANGVLYYNSSTSKLKAFVGGEWKNAVMEGTAVGDYIQNQTASIQTAGFNINGNGFIGGRIAVNATSFIGNEKIRINNANQYNPAIRIDDGFISIYNSGSGSSGMLNYTQLTLGNENNAPQATIKNNNGGLSIYSPGIMYWKDNTGTNDKASFDPLYGNFNAVGQLTALGGNIQLGRWDGVTNFSLFGNPGGDAAYRKRVAIYSGSDIDHVLYIGNNDNTASYFNITNTGTSSFGGLAQLHNSSSDPTSLNGGLFYNSSTHQFRGYRNGAWKNFLMEGDVSGGSGSFIQNQNTAAQTGNFWINGNGTIGNKLLVGSGATQGWATLEVAGGNFLAYNANIVSGYQNTDQRISIEGSNAHIQAQNWAGNASVPLRIQRDGGNLVIGGWGDITPYKLQVEGSGYFNGDISLNGITRKIIGNNGGQLAFNTDNTGGVSMHGAGAIVRVGQGGSSDVNILGSNILFGTEQWTANWRPISSLNDANGYHALTLASNQHLNGSYTTRIGGAFISQAKHYNSNEVYESGKMQFVYNNGDINSGRLGLFVNDVEKLSLYKNGNLVVPSLATNNATAPATTGTTKMVVTDQNGLLSFADIPGASTLGSLLQTSKIIYVDKNNPNATDNRSGISRYSMVQPFATIQAAYNASGGVSGEMYGDIIYVRPGTYNENVSVTTFTDPGRNYGNVFVFDNATLNGGMASAIVFNENFDALIVLNNSVITNTGSSADREGTATIKTITARLKILGNSNLSCFVSSVEGDAYYDFSNSTNYYDRVTFASTNGSAYYSPYQGNGYFTHCRILSTNSFAMRGYSYQIEHSFIKGSSYGVFLGDNIRFGINISNSHIEATNGVGIGAGALGGDELNNGIIKNSEIVSFNQAISFGTGHNDITYAVTLENMKIKILNPAITNSFILPSSNRNELSIRLTNITSSNPLLASDFVNTYQTHIKETNTLVENNSFYVGIKAGFGEQNPTANLHVKGTAIIDVPSGTSNANDLFYSKDITTGQMKLVPAPSGSGGSVSLPSTQIAFGNTNNTITGNNNLTYDGSTFAINASSVDVQKYSQYKLAVNGNAIFTRVKVKESASWPDYVFDNSYSLPPLKHVEAFIKQYKHLPEVPSAEEVKKEGIDIGDNQALLLKKIEELTLYIIDQNKKIEGQQKELEEEAKHNQQLEERLKKLEAKLN